MGEAGAFVDFKAKFRVAELLIMKNDSWSWSVRPAQPTLGAGILSLNRHALQLSDVTPGEMKDLAGIVGILEKTTRVAFSYNIMNYLMLMMVDHHVHYHVLPRYDGVRSFAGLDWVDNGWPAIPVIGDSQHANQPGLLQSLQEKLVASL